MFSDQHEQQQNEWHKDPANWIWGLFYYNKKDSRVFLLKKNPAFGITLNFARPESFLIIITFLAVIIILSKAAVNH
ncbi:MAG: hypothetical protein H0W61_10875 [Bacteroidetes bacterium]|nr:hypothetical protein [Bacteroidota bacterium]